MATEAAPQAAPQFSTDPWIYRIVVIVLGVAVLAVIIGGLLLQMVGGKEMGQGVLAIGSAAAGGLVGLLVPSPVTNTRPGP